MLYLAVLLTFGAVLALILALALGGAERAEARSGLRFLAKDRAPETLREQELLAPLRSRLLEPGVVAISRVASRFMPAGYMASVRTKLMLAGSPVHLDIDRFLALKVVGILGVVPAHFIVTEFAGMHGAGGLIGTGVLWAIAFRGPDVYVDRAISERQHKILLQLPDVLDLLVVAVEAGLGFEQAIDRTIAHMDGVLSEEFFRMLHETRMGVSRVDALRALDERTELPELKSFIGAMIQADTFGVSIGRVLRAQSEDLRVRRRQRAQEEAHKMPVKMLAPMVICIFPALFIVLLAPVAIKLTETPAF